MPKPPPGEDFRGTTAELRTENPWLASEDLMGHEVTVKIAAVKRHRSVQFEDGRKEDVVALHFEGKEKALVLNKTNRRRLTMLYGTNVCAKWIGHSCRLYVEKLKRPAFGDRDHGIRVKYPDADNRRDRAPGGPRPFFGTTEDAIEPPNPVPASRIETDRDFDDAEPPDDWEPA
jgi:hypothetical protein